MRLIVVGGGLKTAGHSLAFRKDRNMWQQQRVSDFTEKLFFSFLAFFAMMCAYVLVYMHVCVSDECSVAVCIIVY